MFHESSFMINKRWINNLDTVKHHLETTKPCQEFAEKDVKKSKYPESGHSLDGVVDARGRQSLKHNMLCHKA